MVAVNANNTTWYVLRYAEDYRAADPSAPSDPFAPVSATYLDDDVFYDEARGVVELLPRPPVAVAAPLPGIAVSADGLVLRSDPMHGRIIATQCDGSERALPCEPGILAQPAGLALDRRGYLYIADPAAGRVVVIALDDAQVVATLGGLSEPIDVAVAPNGRIYVADRGGGEVVVFTPRMGPCLRFPARGAPDRPADPRPIAVMVDADGQIVVADEAHPRLLRFGPSGEPGPDLSVRAAAASTGDDSVPTEAQALPTLFGDEHVRALATQCRRFPSRDVGVALAAVHFALRAHRLVAATRFAPHGTLVTRRLDGGRPGTVWHKVEVEAEIPADTTLVIETATSDAATPDKLDWSVATDAAGAPQSLAANLPDQLVLSGPGRYLWLRVTIAGPGTATPSLRVIRVFYPRTSYTDLLPAVFVADPRAAEFFPRFVALFELMLTRIEDRYERFSRELNPDAAPREVIDWLAGLVDICLDPSWPLQRRRALVGAAMELYEQRGTRKGIERYIELYTGQRPVILESFLERPARPALLGRRGTVIGCGLALQPCDAAATPDEVLFRRHAHRFTIYVVVDDPCDEELVAGVVDRILELSKPAHTVHDLRIVRARAAVGLRSRIGIDLVVGAEQPPRTAVYDKSAPTPLAGSAPGTTLGVDSILGQAHALTSAPRPRRL